MVFNRKSSTMTKFEGNFILRQYIIILTANLSTMCLGLTMAWFSPMIVKLLDGTNTGLTRPITENEASWIASIGVLSSLPVQFIAGMIMDKIGRKTCLFLGSIPRLISWLILLFATDVWMILLARAIDGISVGSAASGVAIYSSEVASKEIRGALGTVLQVSLATGMLISYCTAPFLPYFYVNVMYVCIAIAVLVPIWMLPESPQYLYSKGRKDEAIKVLTTLRGSEILAQEELSLNDIVSNESAQNENIIKIIKDPVTMKTLGKVLILSLLLELIGSNIVMLYMMPILQLTNTSVREEIGSVISGCIQLLACFVSVFLMDRLGRKPILIPGLCSMAVGMISLATFFYLQENGTEITGFLNFMPIISMMLVVFSYNAGLGSQYWALVPELFDNTARAIGVSAGVFTTAIVVFLLNKFYLSMIAALGPALTYGLFSINCIITALFIFFFIPETKGKTFLEIQVALGRNVKSMSV